VWVVLGVALLLLLGLEVAFRVQRVVRGLTPPAAHSHDIPANHPYAEAAWWREWASGDRRMPWRFDAYRGLWPVPFSSDYFNVDSLGRRVTDNGPAATGRSRRVLMLGGSATFGWTARDQYTIPSLVARELRDGGLAGVEVVNLAQVTFGATQGVATLLLELREGTIPDAVVFMDGNNEVAPMYQSGRVGGILNEDQYNSRLMSRPSLGEQIANRFQFIQRLKLEFQPDIQDPGPFTDPELCVSMAGHYARLVEIVETLGDHFGFATLFYWQPLRATTDKPLTPWEESIESPPEWRAMVRRCSTAVDSVLARRGTSAYTPLHHFFDGDTGSVFLDDYGHVTEEANGTIARRIVRDLLPLLHSRR